MTPTPRAGVRRRVWFLDGFCAVNTPSPHGNSDQLSVFQRGSWERVYNSVFAWKIPPDWCLYRGGLLLPLGTSAFWLRPPTDGSAMWLELASASTYTVESSPFFACSTAGAATACHACALPESLTNAHVADGALTLHWLQLTAVRALPEVSEPVVDFHWHTDGAGVTFYEVATREGRHWHRQHCVRFAR